MSDRWNYTLVSNAEVYDPASGTWTGTRSMTVPRHGHTATLLPGGKVLVAGGQSGDFIRKEILATAEVYDPASDTWSATGSMTAPRWGHTAMLLPDGKVLVMGGRADSSFASWLATAEVYDPASGTWSATGSMAAPLEDRKALLLPDGKVLVVGGRTIPEVYDPASGTWSATGSMTAPRWGYTATLLPTGQVLIMGGKAGSSTSPVLATAEVYDPASGTWSATGSMTTPRVGHTAMLLPDGKVLVAGGTPLATSEVYDPVSGYWGTVSTMSQPRFYHSAAPLPGGKVLVLRGVSADNYVEQDRRVTSVSPPEVYTPVSPP